MGSGQIRTSVRGCSQRRARRPSGIDVNDQLIEQILYGLPVAINKVADLSDLWDEVAKDGAILRLLVDHPRQIEALNGFERARHVKRQWSVFMKIDGGQR